MAELFSEMATRWLERKMLFPILCKLSRSKNTSVAHNTICWPWRMGGFPPCFNMVDQKLFLLPLMQDGGPKVISVACDARWRSKSYIFVREARWRSKSYTCYPPCKMAVQKLYILLVRRNDGPKVIYVACDARRWSKSSICCQCCKGDGHNVAL